MIIHALGTPYTVERVKRHEDKLLVASDGYCDPSVQRIVVDDMTAAEGDVDAKKDLAGYVKKVLRHELIHAFLAESGLSDNSWGENEEIVDWIAIRFPKLLAAFGEAGAL